MDSRQNAMAHPGNVSSLKGELVKIKFQSAIPIRAHQSKPYLVVKGEKIRLNSIRPSRW